MQLATAQTLLEIAMRDEPSGTKALSLTQLAEHVGTPQPTMSRLLRALATGDDKLGPRGGTGLVDVYTDPTNYRVRKARLTAAGRSLVRSALKALAKV